MGDFITVFVYFIVFSTYFLIVFIFHIGLHSLLGFLGSCCSPLPFGFYTVDYYYNNDDYNINNRSS